MCIVFVTGALYLFVPKDVQSSYDDPNTSGSSVSASASASSSPCRRKMKRVEENDDDFLCVCFSRLIIGVGLVCVILVRLPSL